MEYTPIKKKTSGLAIASVVLILFAPILAIIFGIISYIQINKNKDRLGGGDLAILGIIGGCIFIFIQAAILFPVFAKAREKARQSSCSSNLKQIGLALMQYSQDYDETYPPASKWIDVTSNYTKTSQVYLCPSAKTKQESYAYNKQLNSKSLAIVNSPADTVSIFDSISGKNLYGGQELLTSPGRHSGGNNFGYADGHIKWNKDNTKLNWDPSFISPSN